MTKEIGGYIELDSYRLPMLHDDGLLLNCGRSCLLYILNADSNLLLLFFRLIYLLYFLFLIITLH